MIRMAFEMKNAVANIARQFLTERSAESSGIESRLSGRNNDLSQKKTLGSSEPGALEIPERKCKHIRHPRMVQIFLIEAPYR